MRDYTKKTHTIIQLVQKSICMILSKAIIEIHGQSKGQKGNPINNALILNLITALESVYNFFSEYMFYILCHEEF